jgi:endonuclease/exonuclease/phosphatase family metal-dependent hydrolase
VSRVLIDIVRRFDVVAIQEIRTQNDQFLRQFCEMLNATGRHYDFVVGPRQGRTSSKEQYAFVFDTASIEVDRSKVYTVPVDPPLLHRPPMVAQFRVRGPPPEQAFTFKLVNIHTDPDDTEVELNTLDDVYRAVRDDGLGEDDVILLGDLNVDDKHLGELGQVPRITWLVSGLPTNTRGTKSYDNILFQRHATVEFTGRAGVFDVMREFNLPSIDEAAKISDHLPIWAEFALYENGEAQIAGREKETEAR